MKCLACGHPEYVHDGGHCDSFTCCDRVPDRRIGYHGAEHDFADHTATRCPCTYTRPAPPDHSQALTTLALCKWLKDRIKEWETHAKAELPIFVGERRAALVGGKVLALITYVKGRKTAKVTDEARLLAFVAEHFPTELEQQVRPAFRDKLLKQALERGALLDPDGVVRDDVIAVVEGDPYPMTKLESDADHTMTALLAAGRLGVNGLTALEGNS